MGILRGLYKHHKYVILTGDVMFVNVPQFEKDGFLVITDTLGEWVIYTPQGLKIVFMQDISLCVKISCIDVRQFNEGFAHANIESHHEKSIQTGRKNMKGFSRKEVKQAALAFIVQPKVAHPPNQKFKQMVSFQSLKNCPVTARDVTNACVVYGPNLPGLVGRSAR